MDDRERARRFLAARRAQLRRSVLIQTDTLSEILAYLKTARTTILAALAGAPSRYESWRLSALQVEVRRAMEAFELAGGAALTGGLDRAWAAGADLVTQPLAAAGIDLSGQMPALDPRLLLALKSFQTDKIRDISTTTINQVNLEIGQAALGVRSPFEAAGKVAELLDVPASRARSIVRTELGTAYSEAGQQRMEHAVKAGIEGLQKQWRRSGKRHPRITHDLADGQIVDVDQPFVVGGIKIPKPRDPSIPIGERINCGCTSLPYMRHWRVQTPGPRPYMAQELATSKTARQVEEVRAQTPVLSRVLPAARLAELRTSLAQTAWGQAQARGERLYGLTDEEALALHAYTYYREAGGARAVNAALRAGTADTSPLADLIAVQRVAVDKLPIVTGEVTRFLRSMPPSLLRTEPGGIWAEEGYASTTRDPTVMEDRYRLMPHILTIRSRTGRDLAALSLFAQREVLFRPGTRYRLTELYAIHDQDWLATLDETL